MKLCSAEAVRPGCGPFPFSPHCGAAWRFPAPLGGRPSGPAATSKANAQTGMKGAGSPERHLSAPQTRVSLRARGKGRKRETATYGADSRESGEVEGRFFEKIPKI